MIIQTLIVSVIVAVAVSFVAWRIFLSIFSKRKNKGCCAGCKGCKLMDELKKDSKKS